MHGRAGTPTAVAIAVAGLLAAGCGGDAPRPRSGEGRDPDPATVVRCQMEVVTLFDPLPAASSPRVDRYTEAVAREGIAYLGTAHGDGVFVLDVGARREIGWLDNQLGASIASVTIAGDRLAFAASGAGVVVYDVSDPRAPARRGHLVDRTHACHTLFLHGDVIYCSTSVTRPPHLVFYRVLTPDDPAAPLRLVVAGSYTSAGAVEQNAAGRQEGGGARVHDVFVHRRGERTLAYLAYWEHGLEVVDVTDPSRPHLVGASAPTPGAWTHSAWVDGDVAYVPEESRGGPVRVYDVSAASLAAPRAIGALRSTGGAAWSAHNVQVAGGFLYASWYQDGLRVFEARGAASNTEVAFLETAHPNAPAHFAGNWDVFVEGGRIYASDMQTGLWVLRHVPTGEPCPPSGGDPRARP